VPSADTNASTTRAVPYVHPRPRQEGQGSATAAAPDDMCLNPRSTIRQCLLPRSDPPCCVSTARSTTKAQVNRDLPDLGPPSSRLRPLDAYRIRASCPVGRGGFARRERPHPGVQLTLFETDDGWRTACGSPTCPSARPAGASSSRTLTPRTGRTPRVEDRIRTGKDTFPSHHFAVNSAWLSAGLIAATLLAWLHLLAVDGDVLWLLMEPGVPGWPVRTR
jgi:hypothetical protein